MIGDIGLLFVGGEVIVNIPPWTQDIELLSVWGRSGHEHPPVDTDLLSISFITLFVVPHPSRACSAGKGVLRVSFLG